MMLYLIALLPFGLGLWLASVIRRIGAVSTGAPIGPRPGTALLLIDLQTAFLENGPYDRTAIAAAEAAILDEVAAARAAGWPIVAVRQEWSLPSTKLLARLAMKGRAVAGTAGTELAAPFDGLADHVLVKRVQDAFETGALDPLLQKLDVGALRLVGLDFDHCVAKTARAARRRGFDVAVVTQATLSAGPSERTRRILRAEAVTLL
ncbi:MAG: isochorismatase family protein [Pseudomonadota bacterium]